MEQKELKEVIKAALSVAGVVVDAVKDGVQISDVAVIEKLSTDPIKTQILDAVKDIKLVLPEIKALSVTSALMLVLEVLPEIKALIAKA